MKFSSIYLVVIHKLKLDLLYGNFNVYYTKIVTVIRLDIRGYDHKLELSISMLTYMNT